MRWRKWGAAMAAASALVSAAGCAALSGADQTPGTLQKIKVGRLALIDSVPLHLAMSTGAFAAEGLEVEMTTGAKGSENVNKVLAGELDFGMTSYPPAIAAHSKAKPLRVVADAVQTKPNSIVVVVNPNGPVKRIEDLIGRKVANSSKRGISELALNTHFRTHGLDPGKVNFISTEIASMPTMVMRGDVDAAIIAEPHLTTALKEGVIPLLDPFSGPTADFPWSGWISTKAYVDKNRDVVARFQRAMRKGAELANSDRSKVQDVLVKDIKVEEGVAKLVTVPNYPISVDPVRLQRVVSLMKENNELDSEKKPIDVDMRSMMVDAPDTP